MDSALPASPLLLVALIIMSLVLLALAILTALRRP
jgi:hypothetical protein